MQKNMKVSCLCLSDDHRSFYVGYSFGGLVEKYAAATGLLVCSTVAHRGDVLTLTTVRPDVLCTSGSDGQVRLLEMSNYCAVPSPTFKTTVSLSSDELVYNQINNGVMSIRRIDLPSTSAILVCLSTKSAPQLVHIRNRLHVRSMNLPSNMDIGN